MNEWGDVDNGDANDDDDDDEDGKDDDEKEAGCVMRR